MRPLGDEASFLKIMVDDFSERLQIPPHVVKHLPRRGEADYLVEAQDLVGDSCLWIIGMQKSRQGWFLLDGWPEFVEGNGVVADDVLHFTYVGRTKFVVEIFGFGRARRDENRTAEVLTNNEFREHEGSSHGQESISIDLSPLSANVDASPQWSVEEPMSPHESVNKDDPPQESDIGDETLQHLVNVNGTLLQPIYIDESLQQEVNDDEYLLQEVNENDSPDKRVSIDISLPQTVNLDMSPQQSGNIKESPEQSVNRAASPQLSVNIKESPSDYDKGSEVPMPLSKIKEGEICSLVCKVLHVCSFSEDEWFAYVWDGTNTPPLYMENQLKNEMHDPLPLHLENDTLETEVMRTFPTSGSILRIVPAKGSVKFGTDFQACNGWLKFVNIRLEVHTGLWQGVIMPFTKLQLSNEGPVLMECKRKCVEPTLQGTSSVVVGCFRSPSQVTVAEHEDVADSTLMQVLTCEKVPAKFRCVVRVVALCPWLAADFRTPDGTYRVRLTLEDPTARIRAYIYAEDGVNFFGENPTTRVVNRLLGVNVDKNGNIDENSPRNPPWIACCIKSYYLNKADPSRSTHYRIFRTKMAI